MLQYFPNFTIRVLKPISEECAFIIHSPVRLKSAPGLSRRPILLKRCAVFSNKRQLYIFPWLYLTNVTIIIEKINEIKWIENFVDEFAYLGLSNFAHRYVQTSYKIWRNFHFENFFFYLVELSDALSK